MQAKKMLIPNYIDRFTCIGASCEDTCCALWEITIDKATYGKYQTITDKPLKEQINKNLIRNKNKTASFKMNEKTGNCSMLCNGLCSIQATLGEDYLSETCSTYPRVLNENSNYIESTAVLSCPEIARLVLLSKDALDISSSHHIETPNLRTHDQENSSKMSTTIFKIRSLILELLNDKEFTLQHQLIMIGVMLDNINQLMKTKKFEEVIKFLEEFKNEVRTNAELRDYEVFPADDKLQFQFLHNNLMDHYKDFIWNQRYNECISEYLKGIQMNGNTLNRSIRTYRTVRTDVYEEYMREHEYIFGNYIINYIFQNFVVDILKGENLFDFYIKLIIDYSLIRLHLIGMASANGNINEGMVVKLVQSYTKNYKFSSKFLDTMLNDAVSQGYASLGGMSLMIK